MIGILKKKNEQLVVEYWYERTSSYTVHPNQAELPHTNLQPLLKNENRIKYNKTK